MIQVLDKGYVRLVDVMGSDLSVVNAARVSYDKESSELDEKDERLLAYLWKHNHTSPFRHASMAFEVYAPLFVARQWWKHVVASSHIDDQSGWNESSRRYVTEEPQFYMPEWRGAPDSKKQGSKEELDTNTNLLDYSLQKYTYQGVSLYERAMAEGVAPEQARLFLPAYGMYVRWRWTVSLHAVLHFLDLRTHEGAQYEIREYADAVGELVEQAFPKTFEIILND